MSRSSSARTRLRASSFCPSVESSSAPSPGSIVAEGWPRIGNVSTERRSPSSNSPPSASCYENSAIQDNLPGQTLRDSAVALADDCFLSRHACGRNRLRVPIPDPVRPGVLGNRQRATVRADWGFADSIASFSPSQEGALNEKSGGSKSSKMAPVSIWPTVFEFRTRFRLVAFVYLTRKYRRPLPMGTLPIR